VNDDDAAIAPGDWIEGTEDRVDALLATPPQQFTAARNALAKQLLAEGLREAAAEVKRLPRPPVSLWILNQLAREQPALIDSYLDAARLLREAHQNGGDIRAATPPQRDAESRVLAAAGEFARTHDQSVTETVQRGLREALSSAAADADVAAVVREGRLIREPEAPSIDELLWSMPQERSAAKTGGPTAEAPRRDRKAERRALQQRIAEATAEVSRARGDAREASEAAEAANRAWKRAEKSAAQAQQSVDAAEHGLEQLQRELDAFEAASDDS
jgi:hypothetical protein